MLYIIMPLLELALLFTGLVILKTTVKLRKSRRITKKQALLGYGISLLFFIVFPVIITRVVR